MSQNVSLAQAAAEPLVSVLMPTFSRRALLAATAESVRAQTLPQWELLIADDGPDEETRAHLSSLACGSRIRVLWLEHSGRAVAGRHAHSRWTPPPVSCSRRR
jgi:glycosyltransferase involved in cell wall biosynthesis